MRGGVVDDWVGRKRSCKDRGRSYSGYRRNRWECLRVVRACIHYNLGVVSTLEDGDLGVRGCYYFGMCLPPV
jgi:hypothetical protein